MSRSSRGGSFLSRAYLIQNVERDRIKHVLDDDSKNRVGSALGLAGTRYLVLSGDRNLAVRVLQQRRETN
jgi:hypothetical protein